MIRLFQPFLVIAILGHANGAILFSADYDITGFGGVDEVVFSSQIPIGPVSAFNTIELELSHSYVGELVLTLMSPTGELFSIMDHDGLRTRVGAGTGLLDGVELYTFVDPTAAALSVTDWDFTRYQPGGTYGAREWPAGGWEAGNWTLTLFDDDTSSSDNGVVGHVSISGVSVPEPSGGIMTMIGLSLAFGARSRPKSIKASVTTSHSA